MLFIKTLHFIPTSLEPLLSTQILIINIDNLFDLIDNGRILPDNPEYRLIDQRIEQFEHLTQLKDLKHPANDDDKNSKRSKDDLKYININKFTLKTTLRGFAD